MRLKHIALLLLVAAGLSLFAFYGWFQETLRMQGPLDKPAIVYVEPGSGTKKIADALMAAGAIDSPEIFSYGSKYEGGGLKAGEYQIPAGASIKSIIELLQSGKT